MRLMELQGYEIKRGQYISVRAKGQERFIRLKAQTLGERYSVEGITKRIENRANASRLFVITVSALLLIFRIALRRKKARATSIGLKSIILNRLQRRLII